MALGVGVAALLAVAPTGAHAGTAAPGTTLEHLAHFAELGSGSTVGPDGALYVTDGTNGVVDRVDSRTGAVTAYATGLPAKVLGIGGAMDVVFRHGRMYVLVTMVGGDIVGGPHFGDATVGIYRMEDAHTFTAIADIGAWSAAHPPPTDFFLTTGVQYAIATDAKGFLVTDGHHNRILHVSLDGQIRALVTLTDVVPTGLETDGGKVWFTEAGPVPHEPDNGRLLSLSGGGQTREIARGARLSVDVERGPRHALYILSQGVWDGVGEGTPALPDTGRLFRVGPHGSLSEVVDDSGGAVSLDRPTSVEFVGDTAYVVSLTGDVYVVHHVR